MLNCSNVETPPTRRRAASPLPQRAGSPTSPQAAEVALLEFLSARGAGELYSGVKDALSKAGGAPTSWIGTVQALSRDEFNDFVHAVKEKMKPSAADMVHVGSKGRGGREITREEKMLRANAAGAFYQRQMAANAAGNPAQILLDLHPLLASIGLGQCTAGFVALGYSSVSHLTARFLDMRDQQRVTLC